MNVTLIGAGNTGLAMAAHLALTGDEVVIYDRSPTVVTQLKESLTIHAHGVLAGTARIAGATTNLREALHDPDLILIMTPSNAHRTLAAEIGTYLTKPCPIILMPDRTCGAIDFHHAYQPQANPVPPMIAETQTVIHTARRISSTEVNVIAIKDSVFIAAFCNEPDEQANAAAHATLPESIRGYFTPAQSMIQTSIGNVGLVLHTAPLLLNSGWAESPDTSYLHYWDDITPRISLFIEEIDTERLAVAEGLGGQIESTFEWLNRSYGSEGPTLYARLRDTEAYEVIEAPKTLAHCYILEDIPYGLVPLERLGKLLAIDMSYSSLIIDLASKLMRVDFRASGRNLRNIHIHDIYSSLARRERSHANTKE